MSKRGHSSAIKGQMVVHNEVTNETIRVPLGAPKAKQWASADAVTQYLQSLVGTEEDNKLADIRVNDMPINECNNLVSLRHQGGVINITAKVLKPQTAVADVTDDVTAPMELETTQLDSVALKVDETEKVLTQKDYENMTPLERMLAVPPEQWLY
ncbi:MAG: hypothetical protein CMM87_07115 [Rickettsiales bacterium]|nr:hypothetical protein [Rickettsiales bacterium]